MSGSDIASEVAQGLAEAGAETGSGAAYTVTLRKATSGPATPWDATATVTADTSLTGVVTKYSRRDIDGELIKATDKKVLIGAGVVVPEVGDSLLIGGKVHEIMSVEETSPAGVPVLYTVQARA